MEDDKPLTAEGVTAETVNLTNDPAPGQTPDSPGDDENGDGLKGGQSTVSQFGDVLDI